MKLEENPPGANKKFSPKEFLCRNLKIVIALSLISTAMSVTSLVIAVTHMHGENGGNINLGDMGFRTANENSSFKMHKRQKRASNDVYSLYCPWGEKELKVYEWEIEQGKTLAEFDDYCQCSRKDMCRVNQYHRNLDCSGPLGNFMEDNMKTKDACVIHDICYKTERSKEKCDEEFIHNFKQICRGSDEGRAISAALGGAVGAIAGVAAGTAGVAAGTAATVIACAIPLINIITCPVVAVAAPAAGVVAGVAAGAASDCNTASLIIEAALANNGDLNESSDCDLCKGSAQTVQVDLGSTSFGSSHTAHGIYTLDSAGDANFGWRPVYKHVKNKAWLFFVPKNRRGNLVAGYPDPVSGGEWYIGNKEIGRTNGWLKADDTLNGIPTQNWYKVNANRKPVRITKWDENGDKI